MRGILPFLKPYRLAMGVALFLMLVELVVELLQPLFMSKMIDDGILKGDISVVLLWGGIMALFTVVSFASGLINSFYAAHASQSFGADIREKLYDKIQSLTFAAFSRFATSSLITRLTNDVTQIQNTLFMGLRIAMRAPLLVIGGVTMAFVVHAKLALIVAVVIPVVVLFLLQVMKLTGKLFRSVQEKLDGVNGVMQENLSRMRLIKAFLRRKHEVQRFTWASGELMDRTVSALRIVESSMPVVLLIMNVSVIVVLWYGRHQIDSGGASVGAVVAVVNYAVRITAALSIVSMIIMAFARTKASAARISEVLETEDAGVALQSKIGAVSGNRGEGDVEFERVSFRYPGSRAEVLDGVSFRARGGERIAIMGATGSGKSTLFQLLLRLYDIEQGAIRVDGVDIRDVSPGEVRQAIGYVPQEAMLFSGTVRENIAWGNEYASEDEIVEAAKRAQIHDTIAKLPQGYDTVIGQRGVNLSGGQKQRLSIARALVRKPAVLLLDDSTSALDVKTEAKLLQELKALSCTTLMITQKISTATGADRIVLLEDGAVLAAGSHDELVRHSSLYQRIYRSQVGEEGSEDAQGIKQTFSIS